MHTVLQNENFELISDRFFIFSRSYSTFLRTLFILFEKKSQFSYVFDGHGFYDSTNLILSFLLHIFFFNVSFVLSFFVLFVDMIAYMFSIQQRWKCYW